MSAQSRYAKTEAGRRTNAKFRRSEKGLTGQREGQARYRLRHRDRIKAQKAVANAVRDGRLREVRLLICADCFNPAEHYHHESYAEVDRLKVTSLCSPCHGARHHVSTDELKSHVSRRPAGEA